jgi:hypothetical protein
LFRRRLRLVQQRTFPSALVYLVTSQRETEECSLFFVFRVLRLKMIFFSVLRRNGCAKKEHLCKAYGGASRWSNHEIQISSASINIWHTQDTVGKYSGFWKKSTQ